MRSFIILISTLAVTAAQWPPPKASAVSGADGYVEIPNAALAPTKTSTYRAIFDATRPADKPTELLPALNMAGSELNALAATNVPLNNAKFAVVFHGPAVDGILDEAHYNAKFGTSNPNLRAIAAMQKRGVEFFVCGQFLAAERIEPKSLVPEVTVAADALLVLIHYQNNGYALVSF
jgi:intracellular sulfur oxidation DsrE/DsrF family protein